MKVNNDTLMKTHYQNGNPVMKGGVDNTYESNLTVDVYIGTLNNSTKTSICEYDSRIDDITKVDVKPHQALGAFFVDEEKIVGTKLIYSNTLEICTIDEASSAVRSQKGFPEYITKDLKYSVGGIEYTYAQLLEKFPIDNRQIRENIRNIKKQYGFSDVDDNGNRQAMPDNLFHDIKEQYKLMSCYTPLTLRVTVVAKHTVNSNGQFISSNLTDDQRQFLLNRMHGYKQRNGRFVGITKFNYDIPITSKSDITVVLNCIRDKRWKVTNMKDIRGYTNIIEGVNSLPDGNTWEALRKHDIQLSRMS